MEAPQSSPRKRIPMVYSGPTLRLPSRWTPVFLPGDRVFRTFLIANASERLGVSAMKALLSFQIYDMTHSTLDLPWLGLLEAIPGTSLVLYGGYIADRHSRQRIVLAATALLALLAGGVALASGHQGRHSYNILLLLACLAAVVRAFGDPAATGLEAQVVPIRHLLPGVTLLSTAGRLAGVVSRFATLLGIPERAAQHAARPGRDAAHGIAEEVRYVVRDQVLLGSMLLDLFAVFFGGATALLLVFATTVRHI